MKVGLIGFGSIGQRHARNLASIGVHDVSLLRRIKTGNPHGFREFTDSGAFARELFDFMILSNPTAMHYRTMLPLLKGDRNLLIEKPLARTRSECAGIAEALETYAGIGMMAYNLRFHPCVGKAVAVVKEDRIGKILYARFFVGQYLPDWRPGRDYRDTYSARASMGGGVILDLSHEIDLAVMLFGEAVSRVKCFSGRFSGLRIDSEDLAEIIFRSASGPLVSIHLDYLYRGYKREFEMIGESGTFRADLYKSTTEETDTSGKVIERSRFSGFDKNDTFRDMIRYYIDCIQTKKRAQPDIQCGLKVMEIALAAKNQKISIKAE